MNSRLAKRLYFAIQKLRGEPVQTYLAEMKKNDLLDSKSIDELQRTKLCALVRHAYTNSPFYHALFKKSGMNINDFSSVEDFQSVPVLTKQVFRENLEVIRATNSRSRYSMAKTSGSTGIPLKFIKDRMATGVHNAAYYRGLNWHGIDVGEKEAWLWGIPVDTHQRIKTRIVDMLLNRFREREYELTPEILHDFYVKMKRAKPVLLNGYSSMVYQFALFVKDNNLDGHALGLKAVKCTSETILDSYYDAIQNVFGCPLICEYGAAETGIVAFSCEKGGIHIMSDFVLVEYAEPDVQVDGFKELIITPLCNYMLPIIRYKIGDLAKPSEQECVCGRKLPLLERVIGRSGAIVYATDGTPLHSIIFYYIFKAAHDKYGGFKQFKVIQKTRSELVVQIARDAGFRQDLLKLLDEKIKTRLGHDVTVSFEFPDQIERDRSGKLADFTSML